jgi:uncharacterized DUF497 family protein
MHRGATRRTPGDALINRAAPWLLWYDLWRMSLEFEWDPKKAEANRAHHGIDFEEALTVFRDPLARIFEDEEHSKDEEREIIVGHSVKQRLIVACFAVRGGRIRLISARKATRLERKDYEENVHP